MLQIKNLTITHKKDLRSIVKDFSLVLNAGDKAVMIGEEGNGKSTVLKWIYAPELIEEYAEGQGERILNRERLGYLPQELPARYKDMTLYEYFSEEPLFWELTPKDLGRMAGEFGLSTEFFYGEQKMGTLSGGVIRTILAEFPGAVLSISHDRKYTKEVCDTVYRLTETGLEKLEE